jgi:hypothetical protein
MLKIIAWVWIATVWTLGAFAGGVASYPFALDVYESWQVYGVPPDYSKPWAPPACAAIAESIGMHKWAREAGARKSLVVGRLESSLQGEGNAGEILGELSLAWDSDTDPQQFFNDCMKKYGEHMAKGKPRV